jgi:hypothetical protein
MLITASNHEGHEKKTIKISVPTRRLQPVITSKFRLRSGPLVLSNIHVADVNVLIN